MEQQLPAVQQRKGPRVMPKACDLCNRMKIKCDKIWPCSYCISRKADCTVTKKERRKHKENRSEYLRSVERRLEQMEALLQASGIVESRTSLSLDNLMTPVEQVEEEGFAVDMSAMILDNQGVSKFFGSSSGLSVFSPESLRLIEEKLGPNAIAARMAALAKSEAEGGLLRNRIWESMPSGSVRPLPARHEAQILMENYFENFNEVLPLFNREAFTHCFNQQYLQDKTTSGASYACFNIVMTMGCMLRCPAPGALQSIDTQGKAWEFFRRATSTYLELVFGGGDIMAVQALLGMVIILLSTASPHPPYMIIATAARLALVIGLHMRLDLSDLSKENIQQRHNVFWIVYMLDKALSMRSGRPSCMNDEDISLDLPQITADEDRSLPNFNPERYFFPCMVRLSRLEGKIVRQLSTGRRAKAPGGFDLRVISRLDTELEKWKKEIPLEIRPESVAYDSMLEYPVCLTLHLAYYNCLSAIHRISVYSFDKFASSPRVISSVRVHLMAVRNIISLSKFIEDGHRLLIWQPLYFLAMAFTGLFQQILKQPYKIQVGRDLMLMQEVIRFLNRLETRGDVRLRRLVALLLEIYSLAERAINKYAEQQTAMAESHCAEEGGAGGIDFDLADCVLEAHIPLPDGIQTMGHHYDDSAPLGHPDFGVMLPYLPGRIPYSIPNESATNQQHIEPGQFNTFLTETTNIPDLIGPWVDVEDF